MMANCLGNSWKESNAKPSICPARIPAGSLIIVLLLIVPRPAANSVSETGLVGQDIGYCGNWVWVLKMEKPTPKWSVSFS